MGEHLVHKECTFTPTINRAHSLPSSVKNHTFTQRQEAFLQRRQTAISKPTQELTFKPRINKRPRSVSEHRNVFESLYSQHQQQQLRKSMILENSQLKLKREAIPLQNKRSDQIMQKAKLTKFN
jgi:hypothetical protein